MTGQTRGRGRARDVGGNGGGAMDDGGGEAVDKDGGGGEAFETGGVEAVEKGGVEAVEKDRAAGARGARSAGRARGPGGPGGAAGAADAEGVRASGTRAVATQPSPPSGMLRALLRSPARLYHVGLGWLLGRRFLFLVTTGRKTGRRRETVLEVVRYDRARHEAIVAAGWGMKTGWFHNVEAGLAEEVIIGRDRFVPEHRVLDVGEAERVFADYERRNRFAAPVVRRVISGLVGWRYDGSAEARRKVVEQLPLVGFRPKVSG